MQPKQKFIAKDLPERNFDVLVVGSGYAGLAAAVEVSSLLPSKDSQVLLIEKMSHPGGNSIMNAGQIAAVGSLAQKMAGIDDSTDLMMEDMRKAGIGLNHPSLIRRMIEGSNEIVRWTEQELGVEYRTRVTQLGGHSVPRTLSTLNASGNDIIEPLLGKIRSLSNVVIEVNTAFETFLVDENRNVQGVLINKQGQQERVLCKHGVILASGGFSADVAFRSIQNPSFDASVMSTNQPGATAEVIKEALKLGAMPVQLSRIQLGPWTSPDETGFGEAPFFCIGAGFPYGIIVDPGSSKRFVNELGNRYERSMAILKLGHPAVCITDSDGAQHTLKKEGLDSVAIKAFASLDGLAANYGMDGASNTLFVPKFLHSRTTENVI